MKKIFFISLIFFLFCNCSLFKYNIPFDKVVFGKGGGFTGKYDEYYIDNKGDLYKKETSSNKFIKSLPKEKIKEIYNEMKKNNLYELSFNNPYNYNYYIELFKGSKSNRIVWGNANNPPPKAVTAVFQKLMMLTATSDIKKQ
ncbi:MAG TPA: hypothetical protein PKK00_00300 [Bacteroidales bacterium]|nr:hypothetical protein [Bacteroidales bacterium]HPS16242.1 hypothetical protein [Bacteroidales bacterium]